MAFKTPREVDRRFTRKLKEDILNKALIDTWALYKSIQVTAEIDYNLANYMSANYTFTVFIFAEVYYVYLDENYTLSYDFTNSRSFENTTDLLRRYFRAYLQNEHPLLNFDNITMELGRVVVVNQP
jgi:hypothetical protein